MARTSPTGYCRPHGTTMLSPLAELPHYTSRKCSRSLNHPCQAKLYRIIGLLQAPRVNLPIISSQNRISPMATDITTRGSLGQRDTSQVIASTYRNRKRREIKDDPSGHQTMYSVLSVRWPSPHDWHTVPENPTGFRERSSLTRNVILCRILLWHTRTIVLSLLFECVLVNE